MMIRKFLMLALFGVLLAGLLVPVGASAEPIYGYDVSVNSGWSSISVSRLDLTKTTTVRLMRGGLEQDRGDWSSGRNRIDVYFYSSSVQPGDLIEVYQDVAWPADPPVTPPTETFTVPPFSVTGTAGSPVVSGTAEDGAAVRVYHAPECGGTSDSTDAARSPGAFSATFAVPMQASESLRARITQPDGDTLRISGSVPGDAGCLNVDASSRTSNDELGSEFGPANPTAYSVYAGGLDWDAIPTARLVLRRGAAVIADVNDNYLALNAAQKPLAGDTIELYRPQDAAAPSMAWTVPTVGGVFDAGSNLTAVDAPAAAAVWSVVCRPVDCAKYTERTQRDTPAGRTIFSYNASSDYNRALDILPTDQVSGGWTSTDEKVNISVDLAAGDLTAPTGTLKLARRFNLAKLGKKIKFKLTSSEAGSAVANLTSTPNLPKRKKGKASATKPVTLASAKAALIAGSNTISLKITSKGKKTIKKMIAAKKTQKATLTVTLTDASGNTATVVKNTKLIVKKSRKSRKK